MPFKLLLVERTTVAAYVHKCCFPTFTPSIFALNSPQNIIFLKHQPYYETVYRLLSHIIASDSLISNFSDWLADDMCSKLMEEVPPTIFLLFQRPQQPTNFFFKVTSF